MEQDTGAIAFQQAFYRKYSALFFSINEKDKSSCLKIRMLIKDKEYVDMTRDELDSAMTKFRAIYRSFFSLKSHLEPSEMKNFDANFNFENFLYINKLIPEYLNLDTEDFTIKWLSSQRPQPDELSKQHLKKSIFNEKFVQLNRENLFNHDTTSNQI